MDFLFSVIAFIVLVGVLVAIHEYGHFIAAKLCNVKVLRYSIGFGKVLASKRSGNDQTEYCLSLIPLGGYVQLLDERSEDVAEEEKDRAFNNQTPIKRFSFSLQDQLLILSFQSLLIRLCFLLVCQDKNQS